MTSSKKATNQTLVEYLADCRANGPVAVLPLLVVERHLDVVRATIKRMCEDGRLEAHVIDRETFITVRSLLAYEAAREDEVRRVRDVLVRVAKAGQTIAYGKVAGETHLGDFGHSSVRKRLSIILGKISRQSWEKDRIMLTTVVTREGGKIGNGFFDLGAELKGFKMLADEKAMFRRELAKVHDHYAR